MKYFAATLLVLLSTAAHAKDYTIIEVNDAKIPYSEVQQIWNGIYPGDEEAPPIDQFNEAVKDNVIRGIVSEHLMLKDAEASNIATKPDVALKLEAARRQVLVQEHLRLRTIDASEADIKKRYDEMVAKNKGQQQIHASHILVESEKEALEIKKLLDEGADFALSAKQRSADVGSAGGGGDLGFFSKDEMVEEFSDAAFDLKKDKVSDPVKTSFGWHLIKLIEKRDVPTPPYAEARKTFQELMRQEANQAYIQSLLSKADITYYDASGKELPFPIKQAEEN